MIFDRIADTGWFSRIKNSCPAVPKLFTALHRYRPKCFIMYSWSVLLFNAFLICVDEEFFNLMIVVELFSLKYQ